MLIYPSTEELLPRAGNRYLLSMLASRRARQLTSGARPTIESETRNRVSLASEEILAGTVVFRYGKHPVIVPEDPLIIAAREAAEREARAKEEEERMEEQSRTTRKPEREESRNVFDAVGISVEDASLIAERFISHVEKMEQREREEKEQRSEEPAEMNADADTKAVEEQEPFPGNTGETEDENVPDEEDVSGVED